VNNAMPIEIYELERREEKEWGAYVLKHPNSTQISKFHFLPSDRLEEGCGEDIQAQTALSDCKRGGSAKGKGSTVE